MADLFNPHDADAHDALRLAQVAVERGIDSAPFGLTYRIPEELEPMYVGTRVVVPLGRGNKPSTGYVVKISDVTKLDTRKLKPIKSRAPGGVALPEQLVTLAKWMASYYVCPLGMVFGAMLPAAVTRGTGTQVRMMVRLADPVPENVKATKLQQGLLDEAASVGNWIEARTLADRAKVKTMSPVNQLVDKGLLVAKREAKVVSSLDLQALKEVDPAGRVQLNKAQQSAVDHLGKHQGSFGVHLLHGVTGSGKTEVYLRAIEAMPSANPPASAIVLVPEIALTPQTVGRFLSRLGTDRVAVLHSGLTAAQRHAQWRRIDEGKVSVVVGARSAIFAPLKNLQLIIVDEEHDTSYKQDQLPRYQARDVAIKRAQIEGIPVVLGSATPSLESYANAGCGQVAADSNPPSAIRHRPSAFHYLPMPDRVPGMRLPKIEIVDLAEERKARRGIHLLSRRLEQRLAETLTPKNQPMKGTVPFSGGGQALLLLNRRGYANYIACPDHRCGWMLNCDHCDASMVYHKHRSLPLGGVVRCHHCAAERILPPTCPDCGNKVTVFGLGTQKVQAELEQKFPDARIARMDSDTMRKADDYQSTLEKFRAGEIDILLGTQMIAKGLDFPGVRLVGIISADTSLNFPDFRARERTFQLIAQVAGRSGRSEEVGRVVLQTFNPDDPAVVRAAAHDFAGFAKEELGAREAMGVPPAGRLVRIVLRDKVMVAVQRHAQELAYHLKQTNETLKLGVRLRGPHPCAIARVADHHRLEILLLAPTPAPLQTLMADLRSKGQLISNQHTAVDVDPVSLL